MGAGKLFRGQRVNILDFAAHTVSQSVLCDLVTSAMDGRYGNGCGCIVAFDGLNLTLVPAFADFCPQRVKKKKNTGKTI